MKTRGRISVPIEAHRPLRIENSNLDAESESRSSGNATGKVACPASLAGARNDHRHLGANGRRMAGSGRRVGDLSWAWHLRTCPFRQVGDGNVLSQWANQPAKPLNIANCGTEQDSNCNAVRRRPAPMPSRLVAPHVGINSWGTLKVHDRAAMIARRKPSRTRHCLSTRSGPR